MLRQLTTRKLPGFQKAAGIAEDNIYLNTLLT